MAESEFVRFQRIRLKHIKESLAAFGDSDSETGKEILLTEQRAIEEFLKTSS